MDQTGSPTPVSEPKERPGFTQKIFNMLFGYDYFLAHRSIDGKPYAAALHDALAAKGSELDCFLDVKHYSAGKNLRAMQSNALKKTKRLVVIVTPHAHDQAAHYLLGEIAEFKGRHKEKGIIVPIGTAETLSLDHYPESKLLPQIPSFSDTICIVEESDALLAGIPSKDRVVNKLVNDFSEERSASVRLRWIKRTAALLAVLLIVAIGLGTLAFVFGGIAEKRRIVSEERLLRSNLSLASSSAAEGRNEIAIAWSWRALEGAEGLGNPAMICSASRLLVSYANVSPYNLGHPISESFVAAHKGTSAILTSTIPEVPVGFDTKGFRVWDGSSGQVIIPSFDAEGAAFLPDGRQLLAWAGQSLDLFGLEVGKIVKSWQCPGPGRILSAHGNSTEILVFSAEESGNVDVFGSELGSEILRPISASAIPPGFDRSVAIGNGSRYLFIYDKGPCYLGWHRGGKFEIQPVPPSRFDSPGSEDPVVDLENSIAYFYRSRESVEAWNLLTGEPIGEPLELGEPISSIEVSSGGIALLGYDHARCWEYDIGTFVAGKKFPITGSVAALSPDGVLFAIERRESNRDCVAIHDVQTGADYELETGELETSSQFRFDNPGHDRLYIANGKTITVYDLGGESPREKIGVSIVNPGWGSFELLGDGSRIVTEVQDRLHESGPRAVTQLSDTRLGVKLWNSEFLVPKALPFQNVLSVCPSPDGTLTAIATNKEILLVDAAEFEVLDRAPYSADQPVYQLVFSKRGDVLASGAGVWLIGGDRKLKPTRVSPGDVAGSALALNPDGTVVASGGGVGSEHMTETQLYSVSTGKKLLEEPIETGEESIDWLHFSSAGDRFAMCTSLGSLTVFELSQIGDLQQFRARKVFATGFGDGLWAAAAHGDTIALGFETGQLKRFDFGTSKVTTLPGRQNAPISTLIFDRRGQRLAVGLSNGVERLVDLSASDPQPGVPIGEGVVAGVGFDHFVVSKERQDIWLWEAATGMAIYRAGAGAGEFFTVVPDPVNLRFFTQGGGRCLVWQVPQTTELTSENSLPAAMVSSGFDPDGSTQPAAIHPDRFQELHQEFREEIARHRLFGNLGSRKNP